MGLQRPLLPNACANPFPVPAIDTAHKKASSPSMNNSKASFLLRDPQGFFYFPWVSPFCSGEGWSSALVRAVCLLLSFLVMEEC